MNWMMVIGSAGVAGVLMYLRMKAHQRLPADARIFLETINTLAQKENRGVQSENTHSPVRDRFPIQPG